MNINDQRRRKTGVLKTKKNLNYLKQEGQKSPDEKIQMLASVKFYIWCFFPRFSFKILLDIYIYVLV